jgi:hypothetical protein
VIANVIFRLSHTYLQEPGAILTPSSQAVSQSQANGNNTLHRTREERSPSGSDDEEESRPKKKKKKKKGKDRVRLYIPRSVFSRSDVSCLA